MPRRPALLSWMTIAVGVAGFGCVLGGGLDVKTQPLGNGEFHLECKAPLSRCLEEADRLCKGNRFEVRTAQDHRDYYGPAAVVEAEVRTSEAVIRCGARGRELFGPTVLPTSKSCVPGATQICVGSGACRGGQTCTAEGNAFGPCDCGVVSAAAAPLPLPVPPPSPQAPQPGAAGAGGRGASPDAGSPAARE